MKDQRGEGVVWAALAGLAARMAAMEVEAATGVVKEAVVMEVAAMAGAVMEVAAMAGAVMEVAAMAVVMEEEAMVEEGSVGVMVKETVGTAEPAPRLGPAAAESS